MRGPFRSALGTFFLLLGVLMLLPMPHPSLWLLDEWAGYHWPAFLWPALFTLLGACLLRARQVQMVRRALGFAFVALVTLAAAALMAQGVNTFTLLTLVLALYTVRVNLDLKAGARAEAGRFT